MKLAVLVLALFLAACGGGGSETPCTAKVVSIQLFGDSTMDGLDGFTHRRAVPDPAGALQALMDARFGVGHVTVENWARSGTASISLVQGTDGLNLPWPQSYKADLAIVNHGLNEYPGDPDAYAARLALFALPGVYFQTPVPPTKPDANLPLGFSDPYVLKMRETAQRLGVPLIEANGFVLGLPNWQSYYGDQLHPNGPLYALIAGAQMQVLAPRVAELRCE